MTDLLLLSPGAAYQAHQLAQLGDEPLHYASEKHPQYVAGPLPKKVKYILQESVFEAQPSKAHHNSHPAGHSEQVLLQQVLSFLRFLQFLSNSPTLSTQTVLLNSLSRHQPLIPPLL